MKAGSLGDFLPDEEEGRVQTEWDYTELAAAYLKRPDYAAGAIASLFDLTGASSSSSVCDVGAGVAHLTLHFARLGANVTAVEPNEAMRELGMRRTREFDRVSWCEATGEHTDQPDGSFDLVVFGSSFNVCDRQAALDESARILRPGGWFACMWNHRDLDDRLQARIEGAIRARVSGYGYGTRRENQAEIIERHPRFAAVHSIEDRVVHKQSKADCIEAWESHATLQRQAGDAFFDVIGDIRKLLDAEADEFITVPYTTRIWAAKPE